MVTITIGVQMLLLVLALAITLWQLAKSDGKTALGWALLCVVVALLVGHVGVWAR